VSTFRFAVVHSLPSAIRFDDTTLPDDLWPSGRCSVERTTLVHRR
jgi:hypothetical protein